MSSAPLPGARVTCHALAPAFGFVAVAILVPPPAAQNEPDMQASLSNAGEPERWTTFQEPGPPVGSVAVAIWPTILTAAQNDGEEHETSWRPVSRVMECHAEAPPVGFVVVRIGEGPMLPGPVAAQNDSEGQDNLHIANCGATLTTCQVEAPPVGSVEVMTLPLTQSTPTQSAAEGHDTSLKLTPGRLTTCQGEFAVGSVEVTTSPNWPTATHSLADGHEMPRSSSDPSTM